MVRKTTKYNAFSLVETMISMIIIMVISLAILPVLTKTRPKIESVAVRGQYACWYDGSQLKQQYMDERTVRNSENVSTCRFDLDKRPAQYFIIASGAGNYGSQGQLVTKYTPSINSALTITVGRTSGNGTTTVGDVLTAGGGYVITANNLVPSNIKSCKLLSAGANCPSAAGQKQESCDVVVANGAPVIRINGCDVFDANGNNQTSNLIPISSLTKTSTYYTYSTYRMGLELYDSSYIAKANSISKMTQVISNMPEKRKSTLTKTISDLNAGAGNRNGAVLIIW
jgi:type II secretory pathway pseudopilin PulG